MSRTAKGSQLFRPIVKKVRHKCYKLRMSNFKLVLRRYYIGSYKMAAFFIIFHDSLKHKIMLTWHHNGHAEYCEKSGIGKNAILVCKHSQRTACIVLWAGTRSLFKVANHRKEIVIYCKILIAVIEFIKRYSCIFVNLIELISNLCMTGKVARFSLFHDRQ